MFENKPLAEIEEADLQELIATQKQEGKTIDYKLGSVGGTDADKKKFLADVSSFANALGGHLIFGVEEENGIPINLCGIELSDPDREIGRLENIVRDGIEPRIPGIEMRAVPLASEGTYALVIRIAQSWQSPHMVSFKGGSRFHSRNSAGKYQLDVSEIRTAFILSETVADRIRDFRADRLSKIIAGDTPFEVKHGPQAVLHLVPLSAFRLGTSLDLETFLRRYNEIEWHKRFNDPRLMNRRNFDGLLYYLPLQASIVDWYVQIFRNGCVEYVQHIGEVSESGEQCMLSLVFEQKFVLMFKQLLPLQQFFGSEPPIFAMLSLFGVRGLTTVLNYGYTSRRRDPPRLIDRDQLIIPEQILDTLECDATQALKPLFDRVWNAAGWPGSPHYDENGNWASRG